MRGCFWRRHPGCKFAYTPKSNIQFWLDKQEGNTPRDTQVLTALETLGWDVLIVWECEVFDLPALTLRLKSFLAPSRDMRRVDPRLGTYSPPAGRAPVPVWKRLMPCPDL